MASPQTDTAALDAWLAEHLLGWTRTSTGAYRCTGAATCTHRVAPHTNAQVHKRPKGLSTTGDGMLMVLEAMRKLGWYSTLDTGWPEGWGALFEGDGETPAAATHDSLPLAVAQAARAALEAPTPATGAEQ